jgi:hypothetical protein
MYWKVPRIVPASVRGFASVGRLVRLGQAEVEKLGSRSGEHDVAGLEVSVGNALTVGRVERRRDLLAELEYLVKRKRAFLETIGEGLTLEILHDEKVERVTTGVLILADIEERTDMSMAQLRDGFGFALESLEKLFVVGESRRQNLDRHVTIESRILRFPDFTHTAGADRRDDLIGPQAGTVLDRH